MTTKEITLQVFEASGLKNKGISNRTGISLPNLRRYKSGEAKFAFCKLVEVADLLNVEIKIDVKKIETFL